MERITKAIKGEKAILGFKRTLKGLRNNTVATVFLAKNCPEVIRDDIEHYAKVAEVQVETLEIPCEELGTLCKKPFMVTVIGVLK